MNALIRSLAILLLIIQPATASANETINGVSLQGRVLDARTHKALVGVNLIIGDQLMGTSTDAHGSFRTEALTPGSYTIRLSCLGYDDLLINDLVVRNPADGDLGILELRESPVPLDEVVVTPGSFSLMGDQPVSRQTMTSQDMKMMSYAEDVTRAVSRLPGVASNDFSSKFTVRGGEADEILMTLDGMELYEPFHQRDFAGGLFSVVDIEAVQGIELQTGGFGAEYGNYQSAVFNMRTGRDFDRKRTTIGLSAATLGLLTEGPFKQGRGHYLFSVRRGILDQVFALVNFKENMPVYADLLAKVAYRLTPRQTASVHLLLTDDQTKVRDVSPEAHDRHDTSYHTGYGWLTLQSILSDKLHVRSMLYAGSGSHDRKGDTEKYEYSDKLNFQLSDKRDYSFYGIKQDWGWSVANPIHLKAGFELKQLKADYNYSYMLADTRVNAQGLVGPYSRSVDQQLSPDGMETGAYLAARLRVLDPLIVEGGLRHDQSSYTDDNLVSPRLSAAWQFNDHTMLRAAWGRYYQMQFISELDVNFDVAGYREAELSEHRVLGIEHQFERGINLRLDVYDKQVSRLSQQHQNLRDPWEVFPEARNDLVTLNLDGARARGVELFLKYDQGRTVSWWLSYARAVAEENVVSIDYDGLLTHQTGWLPRVNNQEHTIYADINYRPGRKWHINLSWQYHVGEPRTIYAYEDTVLPNDSLHFHPRHAMFRKSRFAPYHRMDIKLNRYFDLKKGRLATYLHVINLYNRENIRKFDLDVTGDTDVPTPLDEGGYQYYRDDATWFGILPVVGISWEF